MSDHAARSLRSHKGSNSGGNGSRPTTPKKSGKTPTKSKKSITPGNKVQTIESSHRNTSSTASSSNAGVAQGDSTTIPTLESSRKRSGTESAEIDSIGPAKKKIKFIEPESVQMKQRGHNTPPPRRLPQMENLGISPIKFSLGTPGKSREVYWDSTADEEDSTEMAPSNAAVDSSQFSEMWDILRQPSNGEVFETSVREESASKASISLSKILSIPHRHSVDRSSNSASLAYPALFQSPLHQGEVTALNPYPEVQSLLHKLSTIDSTQGLQTQDGINGSMEDSDEEGELAAPPAHSPVKHETASSESAPHLGVSSSTNPLMPRINTVPSTSTLPIKSALRQAGDASKHQTVPPPIQPSKRPIWGTRLQSKPTATFIAQSTSSTGVEMNPLLQRASSSGVIRAVSAAGTENSPPETITRHSSEPSLSSQTNLNADEAPQSAKDVLNWLEDAGFSYEDFMDSVPNSDQTSTSSTTIRTGAFFEKQGENLGEARPDSEDDSIGDTDTSSDLEAEEKRKEAQNAIISDYLMFTDELTADLNWLEPSHAPALAQVDVEEEGEETALTTSRYRRFLVLEVAPGSISELRLRALDEASGFEHFLCLKDEWAQLDIRIGDYVNIVGRVEPKGSQFTYIVDHQRNLLILHPDVLVSGTMLAQTTDCQRRAIINHCIKSHPRPDLSPPTAATDAATPTTATLTSVQASNVDPIMEPPKFEARPLKSHAIDPRLALYGILVHELFQSAVLAMDFTLSTLSQGVDKIISDHIIDIFSAGDDEKQVKQTLTAWIPAVAEWADKFFPQANTDARSASRTGTSSRFRTRTSKDGDVVELGAHKYVLKVVQPIEVEEHVTSIMYGLKGDIDVSLLIQLTPNQATSKDLVGVGTFASTDSTTAKPRSLEPTRFGDQSAAQTMPSKSLLLPLEIKSGSLSSSFASQVILYSLLMADRYNRDVPTALLFSIKENNTVAIEITRRQVSFAILNRNRVAGFVHRPQLLPPILKRAHPCSTCYQVDSCMILHKAFEHGTPSNSGIAEELFANITMNVTSPQHAAFLSHWFSLIDLESSEILRYRNQVWAMPQAERERQGRCLGAMRLVSMSSKRPDRSSTIDSSSAPSSSHRSSQANSQIPASGTTGETEKSVLSGKRQLFLTFERWPITIGSSMPPSITPTPYKSSSQKTGGFKSAHRLDSTSKTGLDDSVDRTQTDCTPTSRRMSMVDLQFSTGDHVVLSEGRHTGIANCSVVEMTPFSITVVCNRSSLRIPPQDASTILPTSQRFTPVQSKMQRRLLQAMKSSKPDVPDIESVPTGVTGMPSSQQVDTGNPEFQLRKLSSARWRLDRDEVQAGFNSLKGNVIQLFQATHWARKFRPLIVDLEPPKFESVELTQAEEAFVRGEAPLSKNATEIGSVSPKAGLPMNMDQRGVLHKVLSAQDYALVLGMPGTGKTSTIAAIVNVLINRGKTVLISAGTHTAVDGLLLQCQKYGLRFLRLGQPEMVHPELRNQTLIFETQRVKSVEMLNNLVGPGSERYNLVGATCMGANHPALLSRFFDYCIIDEASQITLPVILGPVRLAKTCILVGDLYQLPPVVKNPKASGLSESLFSRLAGAHPSALIKLRIQYRMNNDIMSLSNTLIYQQQLSCGSASIANQRLEIPHPELLPQLSDPLENWMKSLLDPSLSVCFLNTDFIPAPEEKLAFKEAVRNPVEALLVAQITANLLKVGVTRQQIGIISPLRAQLKQIHAALASLHVANPQPRHPASSGAHSSQNQPHQTIDVHTVDKYQGSDVDCVIISLVRSNACRNIGTLLKDWRRLNVAFTRAKRKLIIIGSRSTLSSNHLLSAFFSIIDERGWSVSVPQDAHRQTPA